MNRRRGIFHNVRIRLRCRVALCQHGYVRSCTLRDSIRAQLPLIVISRSGGAFKSRRGSHVPCATPWRVKRNVVETSCRNRAKSETKPPIQLSKSREKSYCVDTNYKMKYILKIQRLARKRSRLLTQSSFFDGRLTAATLRYK